MLLNSETVLTNFSIAENEPKVQFGKPYEACFDLNSFGASPSLGS